MIFVEFGNILKLDTSKDGKIRNLIGHLNCRSPKNTLTASIHHKTPITFNSKYFLNKSVNLKITQKKNLPTKFLIRFSMNFNPLQKNTEKFNSLNRTMRVH